MKKFQFWNFLKKQKFKKEDPILNKKGEGQRNLSTKIEKENYGICKTKRKNIHVFMHKI